MQEGHFQIESGLMRFQVLGHMLFTEELALVAGQGCAPLRATEEEPLPIAEISRAGLPILTVLGQEMLQAEQSHSRQFA